MRKLLFLGLISSLILSVGCRHERNSKSIEAQLTRTESSACQVDEISELNYDNSRGSLNLQSCIVARDGCHQPELNDFSYDREADRLTLKVTEVNTAGEKTLCTMALTKRNYIIRVQMNRSPKSIRLQEQDARGQRQLKEKIK